MLTVLPGGNSLSGGPGTYLYRQIANIVAPEIGRSLDYLESNWPGIQDAQGRSQQNAVLGVLTTFFGMLGDPDTAFRKVDVAIDAARAAAIVNAPVGLVGTIVTVTVMALIDSVEKLGIADTIPDDGGLKDSVNQLHAVYLSTFGQVATQPPTETANGTATNSSTASSRAQEFRQYLLDRATAQVEFERLRCHLTENIVSYMQGIWSQWPDYQILELARSQGIPAEAIEPRFDGFLGALGAVPVTNDDWLKQQDKTFDWAKARADILARTKQQPPSNCITLPTAGMTVEPVLGRCDACEPFIQDHRQIDLDKARADLELARAAADQAKQETLRLVARIKAGKLGDPTPYEADNITVKVPNPEP